MGAGYGDVKGATDASQCATGAASALAPQISGVAGKYSYVEGFLITGLGATSAASIDVTLTGLVGGTWTFSIAIPAGATVQTTPLQVNFPRPRRSTAVNTAIVLNVPSFGTGNTKAQATIFGYTK